MPIVEGESNITYREPEVKISDEGTPSDKVGDADKVENAGENQDIYLKDKLDKNVINILVIGTDTRDAVDSRGRSDTMIVLSYNTETRTAKLISLMRDILVPIEGHGWSRLNHSYAYGGVGLCMNTINATFDLDIQKYVTVNFNALTKLVDDIGGIDVNLTYNEANLYSWYYGWDVTVGVNHLNGDMALKHARLRALDSDFERTRRQRDVMASVYEKILHDVSVENFPKLISNALHEVKTNMSALEILALAKDAVLGGNIKINQGRVPANGTWKSATYEGMSILKIDIGANKKYLHSLIYES